MQKEEDKKQVSNSVSGFLQTAFDYIEEGKYYLAREIFLQLLKQIPQQPNCLFGLGVIYFRNNNRDESKRIFLRILDKHPDSIGPLEYV